MAGGLKLAPLLTEMKVDIAGFKSDMSKAAAIGASEADRISKNLEGTARVGEKLSKAGDVLMKGLTLPIVGAGVASAKMAVNFESDFAKVSTLLDSNIVDFGKYKGEILDASSESKVAVGEFSEAVYSSISAGVDQTKAIDFTTEAMKLAKGGFTDGAKAVDVLTTAINGYGMQAEDVTKISDMLITTQNLGKTTVDELASSMGTVIPVADSVNFGMEELSASYAQLTKNGIATAESGTYLKSMLSELGKSGSITDKVLRDLTGKGFAELKAEGIPTADILKMISDVAAQDGKSLKDMFGSVEAGSAALVLAKGDGSEYNEMLQAMGQSAGATQEAFEKMDATPAEKMKGALNELKNSAIKFGEAFVPVIEKAAGIISKAADAFSNLSEEQQTNALKWGAVLAATGPVVKTLGGAVSVFAKLAPLIGGTSKAIGAVGGAGLLGGFGGLLGVCLPVAAGAAAVGTGIYAIHENSKLMNRSVTDSKEELSLMERVLATLSGTEVKSREELEKLGLVQKEFSDELSPEFQKAVEKSRKKIQEFNVYLQEIGFDGVITQEESDEFNQKVNDTCDEAIQTIQSKKDESQEALKKLFIADDNVIDEGEQRVLEILSQSSDKHVAEVQQLQSDILAIKQNAVNEGRALNEQEIHDIEAKNERIRQIELEALGGTNEEVMYAKQEFIARVETMDAESASKLLQEKAKAREEEIVQIKAGYDTQIEMLKSQAATKTGEEKRALEDQIINLENDKQKKIDIQSQLYDEYLRIVNEKNPELVNAINKYNGEILTNEDIHSQQQLEVMRGKYAGMSQISESGCYMIFNNEMGMFEAIAVTVDQTTGEIVGMYSNTTRECEGYTVKMADDTRQMAASEGESYKTIVSAMGNYMMVGNDLVSANGNVIGSMHDVKESTDGTRQGIIDINGTPYEIQVYKDGTISALNEISAAADAATTPRTIYIDAQSSFSAQKWADIRDGNGSRNFNGIDNVPYDGYRAILHKGERVLTAKENKMYAQGADIDYSKMAQSVKEAVKSLSLTVGTREVGRIVDTRLRERGIL